MKLFIIALIFALALGHRHSHMSQYDLGYEAGLEAAMDATQMVEDGDSGASLQDAWCNFCTGRDPCARNCKHCGQCQE